MKMQAPATPAAKLTAAQIRAGIADCESDIAIAVGDENTARLRAGQARARAALGHGGSAEADAALDAATRHRVALEEKRALLAQLLPEAGLAELLAQREARRQQIAADEGALRTASTRLEALRTELATLEPRVRQLRYAVQNASLLGIDRRIAAHVEQHRAALEAAGVALPGAEQRPTLADIQPAASSPVNPPPQVSANLSDFQAPANIRTAVFA